MALIAPHALRGKRFRIEWTQTNTTILGARPPRLAAPLARNDQSDEVHQLFLSVDSAPFGSKGVLKRHFEVEFPHEVLALLYRLLDPISILALYIPLRQESNALPRQGFSRDRPIVSRAPKRRVSPGLD